MPAQKGRDFLLKIEGTPSGTFQTVAGLRSNSLTFNAATVDITHQESRGGWRELLSNAGLKSASIRGVGLFKDSASDTLLKAAFFNGDLKTYQIILPDFIIITGIFQITSLDFQGQYDGEITFSVELQSAGELNTVIL